MRFWVGVTDKDWFERLQRQAPDEVNFWQPNPKPLATFLEAGVPFLFKLHAPDNYIVGGGFMVRFSTLPARLAWDAFGTKNGVGSYAELQARVRKYRAGIVGDPEIGCNLLSSPFFLERPQWIPVPASFHKNTQRGKSYDTDSAEGAALWAAVEQRMSIMAHGAATFDTDRPRFGADYLARARLGQGAFRVMVTEAYNRRCAVTGEKTLPVLEAAHIRPYAEQGEHRVRNGLLLRADLHKLFDDFYLTVTEDLRLRVSPRIREQFHNGREYYRFDGQPLVALPDAAVDRPAPELLRWHNERFLE
jgi:putative restriction endonuclease